MNAHTQADRDYGFVIGLVTGTFVGAVLAMWFAPRSGSELRQRIADSARSLREQASEQYRQASTRLGDAVDELSRKGESLRNDVAEAVTRGAREIERYATAAKNDGATQPAKHGATDQSVSGPHSL